MDENYLISPQDLISTEYAAYGTYDCGGGGGGGGGGSLPQSDSQTSLHSASQLPPTNRHSTILNVSDPRYSATYGNPYLRSPPKLSTYNTYSTFSPSDSTSYHPVSYIASPASTNTVHSMVSVARSSVEPPLPPPPPGLHPGGSIMGILPSSSSPSTHHRHPVTNDLYAVVSRPGVSFRNINSVASSGSPVSYILDTGPASQAGTHV